jgi:hypothetical protein
VFLLVFFVSEFVLVAGASEKVQRVEEFSSIRWFTKIYENRNCFVYGAEE